MAESRQVLGREVGKHSTASLHEVCTLSEASDWISAHSTRAFHVYLVV